MAYIGKEPQFTQYPSKFFDGDNSAMTVSLDYVPPNDASLLVFIDGVRQDTSAYTCTGTSLTFTGAVPTGTANVQVVHMGLVLDVGVPGDNTVTSAKIVDGTIATADIADDAITAAKIVSTARAGPSLGTSSVIRTNANTISENITIPSATNGMSVGPITIADTYTVTVSGRWAIL